MASGIIKTVRADKGFGFIKRDGEPMGSSDLFFHMSAVQEGHFEDLQEGQRVTFDQERDPRDPSRQRANNVRPVGEPAGNQASDNGDA